MSESNHTQLSAELEAEANNLLSQHILHHVVTVMDEVVRHYPAILDYFANPKGERPSGVPEWIYAATFDATDPDGLLCWPIFRGSLMSRAYSSASGCHVTEPSLALKAVMVELGFSHGHDGAPDDSSSWIECAAITGAGVAKALGESIYRRLLAQMNELDSRTQAVLAS